MSDIISITGNLTSAPERLELAGGVTMVRFGLASTERRLDGGVWTDVHTNYYNVAVFRKLAEHAYQSLERGQRVIVVGKLKVRPWESNGRSGTSMDLEASSLGPDLMFGVASFTRTTRAVGHAETSSLEAEPSGASPAQHSESADASARAQVGATAPRADAPSGELVSAAAWGASADGEQTPF